MLQCFLEVRTAPLSACFWGRAAVQGFMSAEQNRLKPVWGRQRSDRNNTISVIHRGAEIAWLLHGSPLHVAAMAQSSLLLLLLVLAATTCDAANSEGGREIWEGKRAARRGCLWLCSLHTNAGACSICLYVCVWLEMQGNASEEQQQHSADGCNLTLCSGPLAGWEETGRFFQAGWGGWLFFYRLVVLWLCLLQDGRKERKEACLVAAEGRRQEGEEWHACFHHCCFTVSLLILWQSVTPFPSISCISINLLTWTEICVLHLSCSCVFNLHFLSTSGCRGCD